MDKVGWYYAPLIAGVGLKGEGDLHQLCGFIGSFNNIKIQPSTIFMN